MKTIRWQTLPIALVAIVFSLATLPAHAQWTNTATLTASDGQAVDYFGSALAVDGNTLVVGAPAYTSSPGAAYVFTESNGVWTQVAELTPSDGVNGLQFGISVGISGNTVVVGADSALAVNKAAAYVFVKPATGWTNMTQTAKLTSSDPTGGDFFGDSVAISNNTIAVGARWHDGDFSGQGAAYIFVKPATGWTNMTQTAELTASDAAQDDELGIAVAIQGSTVVAGAVLLDNNTVQGQGAAYVFEEPVGGWANEQQTAKLTATDPTIFASLGAYVAISADEATIVAGAPQHNPGSGHGYGAAYIYSKPASGWQSATQSSELLAPNPAVYFASVAINGPGTIIAVGAPGTSSSTGVSEGSAYVYRKPSTGWPPLPQANARINPPSPQKNGYFGQQMAVRATTVFAGEYGATVNGNAAQGAVYVFDRK
jgi:hypothetical protein